MKLGIFITGTDTGVGKTVLSSLLIASLHSYRIKTGYFKPVQTGTEEDTQTVANLTGMSKDKFPAPVYSFPEPISPNRAAALHQEEIQIDRIVQAWDRLDDRAWVVEGAGGLLVPLNQKQRMRDLVCALKLRLIIAARTQLGTINHTLLTVEAAQAAKIPIAGIVLIGPEDPGLGAVLTECSGVPILSKIPSFPFVSEGIIRDQALSLFPASKLGIIYE
jgi:dethiobiotin synthase